MTKGKGIGLENKDYHQQEAEEIANEFTTYLNDFHSKNIQVDDEILVQLYKDYVEMIPNVPKPKFKGHYPFRSSSTGKCAREHFMRLTGEDADKQTILPQTTRWQNLGTRIGDMIQFDLLLAEKHHTGQFKFERVKKILDSNTPIYQAKEYPHFEEFSTTTKFFNHKGEKFAIHGSTDGIMIYTKPDGTQVRVGLEVKSKQTSYSKTTHYSMKTCEPKHKKQTVAYSTMFDVDYWIILYVNASKKAWNPSEEDLVKCPDIRAFGHYVTPEMREEVLDRFSYICNCVENNTPPPLELNNWNFNEYKTACAKSLTNQEFLELLDYVESEEVSTLPAWQKNNLEKAVEQIATMRGIVDGKE